MFCFSVFCFFVLFILPLVKGGRGMSLRIGFRVRFHVLWNIPLPPSQGGDKPFINSLRSACSYRKNGLFFFSYPMEVEGPCPGYTLVASGRVNSWVRMPSQSSSKLPPFKSARPMLP